MKRREFLKGSALAAGAAALFPTLGSASMIAPAKGEKIPEGPVTLYFEFRIPGNKRDDLIRHMREFVKRAEKKRGFLSLSFKNMVGDSTMVKNYPTELKGVLKSAYIDAFKQNRLPLFYALFVRFASYHDLKRSDLYKEFAQLMQRYGALSKNYFEGVFVTVAAGDREKIYSTSEQIRHFLTHQKDHPIDDLVTVNNHVSIHTKDKEIFNKESAALLKIAQDTFRPAPGDPDYNPKFPDGMPGAYQTHHYRKAVTTEILQSAFSDGGKTHYLFHGTWESVWDHENSHIDPRFRNAVAKLFPYLLDLPVEPFYKTLILTNKA